MGTPGKPQSYYSWSFWSVPCSGECSEEKKWEWALVSFVRAWGSPPRLHCQTSPTLGWKRNLENSEERPREAFCYLCPPAKSHGGHIRAHSNSIMQCPLPQPSFSTITNNEFVFQHGTRVSWVFLPHIVQFRTVLSFTYIFGEQDHSTLLSRNWLPVPPLFCVYNALLKCNSYIIHSLKVYDSLGFST